MPTAKGPKITALNVWTAHLKKLLERDLVTHVNRNVKTLPSSMVLERTSKAMRSMVHFETFKHQTLVNEMNRKLNAAKDKAHAIAKQMRATPFIRFAKRRALAVDLKLAEMAIASFEAALSVLVDTTPPVMATSSSSSKTVNVRGGADGKAAIIERVGDGRKMLGGL